MYEDFEQLCKSRGVTAYKVCKDLGISQGTISNWKSRGNDLSTSILKKIADYFEVDVNYLLTEDEEFVVQATEQYGTRGMKQAQELIDGMSGLFAGGTLSPQDEDAVMKALQDIYWAAKARNVEKYTPKKFKAQDENA